MLFSSTDVKECFEWYYMPSNWSQKHVKDQIITHFISKLTEGNQHVAKHFKSDLNVPYGESNGEKIDFFYPSDVANENLNGLPIFVYIHGGYWQEGDRSFYHCIAKPYIDKKCIVGIMGYDLSSDTHKVSNIEKQCVKGFEFLKGKFPKSHWVIAGHSAGGYLATSLLNYPVLLSNIEAVISISGLFQLNDLQMTSVASAIDLSDLDSQNLLLREYKRTSKIKMGLFVGGDESPIFHYQSLKMYEKLMSNIDPADVCLEIIPGEDHFSLIENMMKETSSITQFVFELIK